MNSEIEALKFRIERLEVANRQIRLTGLALLLVLVVILSTGLAGKPRIIEAELIRVRDSHGRARITIGTPEFAGAAVDTKPDEPVIWLSDEKDRQGRIGTRWIVLQ